MPLSHPFLVTSEADYHAKHAELQEALAYARQIQYQLAAALILRAFVVHPEADELQFHDNGSRDCLVSHCELMGAGDVADQDPDVDILMGEFFDDPDFRADLCTVRFSREGVVDQLDKLIGLYNSAWDVSWTEFVQKTYADLGHPELWEERLARQAQETEQNVDGAGPLFKALREGGDWEHALDNAPDNVWRAQRPYKGLDGEIVHWSPLACAAMLLLRRREYVSHHPLRICLTDAEDPGFLKLAGPSESEQLKLYATEGSDELDLPIDSLAVIWIASQRDAFASNSYQRNSSADPLLAWADSSAQELDARAMHQASTLLSWKDHSGWINHEARQRLHEFVNATWDVWCSGHPDGVSEEGVECFADAVMELDTWPHCLPGWALTPHTLGSGLVLVMENFSLNLKLRLGLATLHHVDDPDAIAIAEAHLLRWMDEGARLRADDPFLDKFLAAKGLTEAVRERLLATLDESESDRDGTTAALSQEDLEARQREHQKAEEEANHAWKEARNELRSKVLGILEAKIQRQTEGDGKPHEN